MALNKADDMLTSYTYAHTCNILSRALNAQRGKYSHIQGQRVSGQVGLTGKVALRT